MGTVHRAVWIDNSSSDQRATSAFYGRVFGWDLVASDDPQYGGYVTAQLGGKDVAGFGTQQDPNMPPSVWNLFIGTDDAVATAAAAKAAGGTVIMEPFPIGTMGTSAFIADPAGAVFGLWQAAEMAGFQAEGSGTFGWAEVTARDVERVIPFYGRTFGWAHRTSDMGDGTSYTEFLDGEESLLGALEMPPGTPAEVPSYWLVYFAVDDLDAAHQRALDAGGTSLVAPRAMPGGRFAIVADPLGGTFGLLKLDA